MKIGGHRGCGRTDDFAGRHDVPQENSAASIREAFVRGADFIETDLCLDGEGRGWLIHSSRLSLHIQSPPTQYLDQLSTAQVSRLTGLGGQGLYSLDQLFDDWHDRSINLEIKLGQGTDRNYQDQLDRLLSQDWNWPDLWWLSSFDARVLSALTQRWPHLAIGQLTLDSEFRQPLYPGDQDGVQSFSSANQRHCDWAIHAEAGDALMPTDRPVYLWSLDIDRRHWPSGVQGVITDRLEDFMD